MAVSDRKAADADLLADLQAAGYLVRAVWDLREVGPEGIDILIRHLVSGRHLSAGDASTIGQCLQSGKVPRRREVPIALLRQFRMQEDYLVRESLAGALSRLATKENTDELVEIVRDLSQGDIRVLFFQKVYRLLGDKGLQLWRDLVADPDPTIRVLASEALCKLNDVDSVERIRAARRAVTTSDQKEYLIDNHTKRLDKVLESLAQRRSVGGA